MASIYDYSVPAPDGTEVKLADYKGLFEKFSEAGAVRTAGGAAAIKAEAERYDKILRPFGSADGK